MGYHILNPDGSKVASFEHECDRDLCFDAMEEYYGKDCLLTVRND